MEPARAWFTEIPDWFDPDGGLIQFDWETGRVAAMVARTVIASSTDRSSAGHPRVETRVTSTPMSGRVSWRTARRSGWRRSAEASRMPACGRPCRSPRTTTPTRRPASWSGGTSTRPKRAGSCSSVRRNPDSPTPTCTTPCRRPCPATGGGSRRSAATRWSAPSWSTTLVSSVPGGKRVRAAAINFLSGGPKVAAAKCGGGEQVYGEWVPIELESTPGLGDRVARLAAATAALELAAVVDEEMPPARTAGLFRRKHPLSPAELAQRKKAALISAMKRRGNRRLGRYAPDGTGPKRRTALDDSPVLDAAKRSRSSNLRGCPGSGSSDPRGEPAQPGSRSGPSGPTWRLGCSKRGRRGCGDQRAAHRQVPAHSSPQGIPSPCRIGRNDHQEVLTRHVH